MSQNEIHGKIQELRELRCMADELDAEITAIEDSIKAHMTAEGTDTLSGTDYKVTWKPVLSSRFDSTAFKKAAPDMYAAFTKQTESRCFLLA